MTTLINEIGVLKQTEVKAGEDHKAKENAYDRQERDETRVIEDKYTALRNEAWAAFKKTVGQIDQQRDPVIERLEQIKQTMSLSVIKRNLHETTWDKCLNGSWRTRSESSVTRLRRDDHVFITLYAYTTPNEKPVNKIDLAIRVVFKHPRLKAFFRGVMCIFSSPLQWASDWLSETTLVTRSFPSEEKAAAYLERNYDRLTNRVVAIDMDVYQRAQKANVDISQVFDFSHLPFSYSGITAKNLGPRMRSYELSRPFKDFGGGRKITDLPITLRVRYLGEDVFLVDQDHEDAFELVRSSLSSSTEERPYWFNEPTILVALDPERFRSLTLEEAKAMV